jgi:hypothetical protein
MKTMTPAELPTVFAKNPRLLMAQIHANYCAKLLPGYYPHADDIVALNIYPAPRHGIPNKDTNLAQMGRANRRIQLK